MGKKKILTVFICISLTIGVIGIVIATGNKKHPDLLNNRVVEGIALHKDEEQEALGPAIQKLRIDLDHRTFLESQKETKEIERLELDDLEEREEELEEELEEFERDEIVPPVTNERDIGRNGGQGVDSPQEKETQQKDPPKPAKKSTTSSDKNLSASNKGKDDKKDSNETDKGKDNQEKPGEPSLEEDDDKEEPTEDDETKDDEDDEEENDGVDNPDGEAQ